MKAIRTKLIFPLVIISILCLIFVWIFTLPAFLSRFDFSNILISNIGSSINGLTAPIIGISSAVLLYVTLSNQIESNEKQYNKNEIDFILQLISHLNDDISRLYYYDEIKNSNNNIMRNPYLKGVEALHIYVEDLRRRKAEIFKGTNKEIRLQILPQLELIILSFNLIENRISISKILPENQNLLNEKLNNIYKAQLQNSIEILVSIMNEYPHIIDSSGKTVIEFYDKMKLKMISN